MASILNTLRYSNKPTRDNWLKKTLSEIPKGIRILDAGAGELSCKGFCDHLKYVSQDFAQYDGKGDDNGLQTGFWDNSKLDIVSDITDIPVDSNSFQAVLCVEVFEHIPDPISAIREFSRILEKGGTLILTAPVSSYTHFAPYFYYNGFSRYFYEKHLLDNGFQIEEISFNGNFFNYLLAMLKGVPSIANKYLGYGKVFKYFFLLWNIPLMLLIAILAKKDKASHELHSTGIHVVCKKT